MLQFWEVVTWSSSRSKVTFIIIQHFGTVLETNDPLNHESEDDIPDGVVVDVVRKGGVITEPATKDKEH